MSTAEIQKILCPFCHGGKSAGCQGCYDTGILTVEFRVEFGEATVHVSVCVQSRPWIKGATSMPWTDAPDEAKFKAMPDYEEMKGIALGDLG